MKSMKGNDMFAPAEEFSEMLEENADEVMTGSHTLINRDKSGKHLSALFAHALFSFVLFWFVFRQETIEMGNGSR